MNRALRTASVTGAVVAVACAVLAAVVTQHLSNVQASSHARSSALAAARQLAVDYAAYDYRHIDKDFTRVTNETTGAFKQEFATQAAGLRELVVSAKVVSTAEVAAAGVVTASPNSAVVDVALTRSVTNTQVPKGATAGIGVEITLARQHGRWLLSNVKPL